MRTAFIAILVLLGIAGFMYTQFDINTAAAEVTNTPVYDDKIMKVAREYENAALRNRKLVAMPMSTPNNGPFGSFHYNPDTKTTPPVDVYTNVDTACAFQNTIKQWNETFCKDLPNQPYEERGCRVAFGNISHRNKVTFPPHRSHKDGTCIDVRPMQIGSFRNAPLIWNSGRSSRYDRTMTSDFMELARANGASMMLFNDPSIRSRRSSGHYVPGVGYSDGHDNHMHICFDPKRLTQSQKTCPANPLGQSNDTARPGAGV